MGVLDQLIDERNRERQLAHSNACDLKMLTMSLAPVVQAYIDAGYNVSDPLVFDELSKAMPTVTTLVKKQHGK